MRLFYSAENSGNIIKGLDNYSEGFPIKPISAADAHAPPLTSERIFTEGRRHYNLLWVRLSALLSFFRCLRVVWRRFY